MANSTSYLDSKKRRIYKGDNRGYYTNTNDGERNYAPKAMYRKSKKCDAKKNCPKKLDKNMRKNVPVKIRPAPFNLRALGTPINKMIPKKPVINLTKVSKSINKRMTPKKPIVNLTRVGSIIDSILPKRPMVNMTKKR